MYDSIFSFRVIGAEAYAGISAERGAIRGPSPETIREQNESVHLKTAGGVIPYPWSSVCKMIQSLSSVLVTIHRSNPIRWCRYLITAFPAAAKSKGSGAGVNGVTACFHYATGDELNLTHGGTYSTRNSTELSPRRFPFETNNAFKFFKRVINDRAVCGPIDHLPHAAFNGPRPAHEVRKITAGVGTVFINYAIVAVEKDAAMLGAAENY